MEINKQQEKIRKLIEEIKSHNKERKRIGESY